MTPIWLALTLFLAFTLTGVGSNRGYAYIHTDMEDAIDKFVKATLECREIVGLNLAVVRGNKTLIAKGYGISNQDTQTFVDEKTKFGIASLTKAFASTLLGILIDENDRSVEEGICHYSPVLIASPAAIARSNMLGLRAVFWAAGWVFLLT